MRFLSKCKDQQLSLSIIKLSSGVSMRLECETLNYRNEHNNTAFANMAVGKANCHLFCRCLEMGCVCLVIYFCFVKD